MYCLVGSHKMTADSYLLCNMTVAHMGYSRQSLQSHEIVESRIPLLESPIFYGTMHDHP